MECSVVGRGPQPIIARKHVFYTGLTRGFEAAVLVSVGNVLLDVCLRRALRPEFCLVQIHLQKCPAAFGVVTGRLDRCFIRLYEMPLDETAWKLEARGWKLEAAGPLWVEQDPVMGRNSGAGIYSLGGMRYTRGQAKDRLESVQERAQGCCADLSKFEMPASN